MDDRCPYCEGIGYFSAPVADGGPVKCVECMGSGEQLRDPDAGFDVSDGVCGYCGWPEDNCDCYESDEEYGSGDDDWNDDYDLDGCRVFDAHGYLSRRFSGNRAARALHLALDQQAEPKRATIRAIYRSLSPVGTELGGHPWQRRRLKLRRMQAERKHLRAWRCPECGKGVGPTLESCNCNPF